MTDYRIAVRSARRTYTRNSLPIVRPFVSVKRVGVMTHYRIGRFGGSFYFANRDARMLRNEFVRPYNWRDDIPSYLTMAGVFVFFLAAWLAVGINSGFVF